MVSVRVMDRATSLKIKYLIIGGCLALLTKYIILDWLIPSEYSLVAYITLCTGGIRIYKAELNGNL